MGLKMQEKELTPEQKIIQAIIDVFGTQDDLAQHIGVDQSTVSGWLKRETIPSRRQRQIMEASQKLYASGKITRPIVPGDFYALITESLKAA